MVADVAEIGFHVLHPVQPECMDAPAIKQRLGDRIVLCATLGAQRTLARGTPAEVEAETTRVIDALGADRRCLVCPSNRIQPETPWENVLAFERAARGHPLGDGLRHPQECADSIRPSTFDSGGWAGIPLCSRRPTIHSRREIPMGFLRRPHARRTFCVLTALVSFGVVPGDRGAEVGRDRDGNHPLDRARSG